MIIQISSRAASPQMAGYSTGFTVDCALHGTDVVVLHAGGIEADTNILPQTYSLIWSFEVLGQFQRLHLTEKIAHGKIDRSGEVLALVPQMSFLFSFL
jgi:hypothetical protein